jgi:hypothetical protein
VEFRIFAFLVVAGCATLLLTSAGGAQVPAKGEPGDPVFIRWLQPHDPYDQTILEYWEQAERNELDAEDMVDLGTMLFRRGYPNDAIRIYRRALKMDSKLYEAWFRIGLVKYHQGEADDARQAYRKCLKFRPGHGWCNFYLGLLEEKTKHPSKALEYYDRAFKHAPVLADPEYNSELLNSKLYLGPALSHNDRSNRAARMPMSYLQPNRVNKVWSRYAPTPTPSPTPPPAEERDSTPDVKVPTPSGSVSGVKGGATQPAPRTKPRRRYTPATPPADTPYGVRGQPRSTPTPAGQRPPSNVQPTRTP